MVAAEEWVDGETLVEIEDILAWVMHVDQTETDAKGQREGRDLDVRGATHSRVSDSFIEMTSPMYSALSAIVNQLSFSQMRRARELRTEKKVSLSSSFVRGKEEAVAVRSWANFDPLGLRPLKGVVLAPACSLSGFAHCRK